MIRTLGMSLAVVAFLAGPALAGQCPTLIAQINAATSNRLDAAAYSARTLAKDAEDLHKAGKHPESEAKADEAAKAAGITLKKK
jgi:hypothetical protein